LFMDLAVAEDPMAVVVAEAREAEIKKWEKVSEEHKYLIDKNVW